MKIIISGLMLLMVAGCESNNLVYVQDTSFGLTVGASMEGTQKLSLGYDRDIYAVVPKKESGSGDGEGEAMSLLSVNQVEVTGLQEMKISEFVAGGDPATNLAKQPKAVSKIRHHIY